MLIKFFSKAGGEVLMFSPIARSMLVALGHDPDLARGAISEHELPAAMGRLQQFMHAPQNQAEDATDPQSVSLRKRAVPLLELLERSQRMNFPVSWEPLK